MPKTKKLFDWEIYDGDKNFIDILSMTRDDAKTYQKNHPEFFITEIAYNDGEDDTRESSGTENRNIHSVCIPRRRKKLPHVHKTSKLGK